jgi:hypothetical protein
MFRFGKFKVYAYVAIWLSLQPHSLERYRTKYACGGTI